MAFDDPVVDHLLERKIAQTVNGSTEKDRSNGLQLHSRTLYYLSYIPLPGIGHSEVKGRKGVIFIDVQFLNVY